MEEPLYAHALLGFRHWVAGPDMQLYPLVKGHLDRRHAWTPGVNTAICIDKGAEINAEHSGLAPVGDCSCGIHAYYQDPRMRFEDALLGTIAARGQIRLHREGFRCRQAQLLGLLENPVIDAEAYAEHYQVPVFSEIAELEAYSLRWTRPLPTTLIAELEELKVSDIR